MAFSMYSKIPMPHIEWTNQNMRYTLCFFPLIGAVIGVLEWLWYHISVLVCFGTLLRGVIFVLIPVLITGGIHLDGLLDTADALSSWQTKERRLEILKDSHVGAFAIIVCCCYFVATVGIWSEAGLKAVQVMGVGFIMSRALSGYGVCSIRCAKGSGLAATFANAAHKKNCRICLGIETACCVFLMIWIQPILGISAGITSILVYLLVKRMAMHKFGGTTGDIQGFFLESCELAIAFVVIFAERMIV